jgi:hypothetical protein
VIEKYDRNRYKLATEVRLGSCMDKCRVATNVVLLVCFMRRSRGYHYYNSDACTPSPKYDTHNYVYLTIEAHRKYNWMFVLVVDGIIRCAGIKMFVRFLLGLACQFFG